MRLATVVSGEETGCRVSCLPENVDSRRYAQQNVGAAMAKNAKFTIVEVSWGVAVVYQKFMHSLQADDAAPVGSLSPNAIHILGIYVDRMVQSTELN
jgi:3-oxoacid CoA-transferase